jgi:hypothetical protein
MLAESGVRVGGGSGKSSPVVAAYDCARDDKVAFSLQLGAKNIVTAQGGGHGPLAGFIRVRSGKKLHIQLPGLVVNRLADTAKYLGSPAENETREYVRSVVDLQSRANHKRIQAT